MPHLSSINHEIQRGKNTVSKHTIIIIAVLCSIVILEAILYEVSPMLLRLELLAMISIGIPSLSLGMENW